MIFGLRAKQLEEQSSQFEKANTKNELLLAVRDSYYAVALYDRALEIQRINVGYLSEALLQEQEKLTAGNSTPYEVNQSKAALANAISVYYDTLKGLKKARNALILTLGVDPLLEPELSLENSDFPLASIPEIALKMHSAKKKYCYGSGHMPTTEEMLLHIQRIEEAKKLTLFSDSEVLSYLELALKARPDLQKSRVLVGVAEQNLKSKLGTYAPEISGYVRYSYNDGEQCNVPFFKEPYILSGGVYLNWRLFDSLLREHEIREASSQKRSARITFDKELQRIEVELRNSLYQFEESLFAFLSSDEAVLVAEQAREQAQDKLAYGRIPPLEYRDSVNQLAQARNLRNRASFDLIAAYYELRYVTGQDALDH